MRFLLPSLLLIGLAPPSVLPSSHGQELFADVKPLCKIDVGYGQETLFFAAKNGWRIVDIGSEKDASPSIAFPPDGKFKTGVDLLAANKRALKSWDVVTGKEVPIPSKELHLMDYKYGGVSPDETKYVKIDYLDPIVPMGGFPQPGPGVTRPFRYKTSLIDLTTNKLIYAIPMDGYARPSMSFSPDSSVVALIGDSEITFYRIGAAKPVQKVKLNRKMTQTVYGIRPVPQEMLAVFSANGNYLALTIDGVVRIFDVAKAAAIYETPPLKSNTPYVFYIQGFAWPRASTDNRLLTSATAFNMFDVKEKKMLWQKAADHQTGAKGLLTKDQPFFSAKGEPRALYTTSKYQPMTKNFAYQGVILDAATGKILRQFESQGYHKYMVSADGQYLARTSYEKTGYKGKQTVETWKLDDVLGK